MKRESAGGKLPRPKRMAAGACFIILALLAFVLLKPWPREAEWKPGMPLTKDRVKIGVIYMTDVTNETGGYTYAHDVGIMKAQEEIGLRDDQIIRKVDIFDTDIIAATHAIRECIAQGANIIIATTWGYMDACEKLAAEYPDVIFAHATGNRSNDANFTNYFGRIYQARYLSGIAAGLRTGTNKIGYVAAMGKDNSEVTGGLNAFALGVEKVNKNARVHVRITHRWYDPNGELEAARLLINQGCDVIAQHCDTPSPQLAAKEAGVWGIGYNIDMSPDAPDAVVTSVVWDWGVYYTWLIKSVIDGSFTTKPYYGGLKEGIVNLAPFSEHLLPAGASEAVIAERKRIESGEFDVFDGPMETNDGQIVGEEGGTLPDSVIQGQINWYYRNVTEVR